MSRVRADRLPASTGRATLRDLRSKDVRLNIAASKPYEPGYIHIGREISTENGRMESSRRYLFVAIRPAPPVGFYPIYNNKTAATRVRF